jgi:predicted short-subunit dehydrogenase-like oxidoreductase (DUF2520 family)
MRELERDPLTPGANAHPTPLPGLLIVGAGRVGESLARAARAAEVDVSIAGRADVDAAIADARAVLLCVPDEAIGEVAARLAPSAPRLELAGHTSGASTLEALAPFAAAGARTFSLHPLQTVPDGATDFTGCPAAIAGADSDALALARALAERLEMRPFAVPEEHRAAYHAAAAIASNFLVALEQSATELLERTGVGGARELLAPLVLRTAANWSERGAGALTGPIARGDEATVGRHLAAIEDHAPELASMYAALAERTRAIAEERDR